MDSQLILPVRRAVNVPVMGGKEFCDHDLKVDPEVLEFRAEYWGLWLSV